MEQNHDRDKRYRMEKTVNIIGSLRWASLPLGCIMYVFSRESFGEAAASFLGALFGCAFWFLIRHEKSRLIGQTIASEIRAAISEAANVESFIEIKRLRSGIIARIYLINAKDKVTLIHRSVARRMENCSLKKYLWILQMTDMPGKNALHETQKILNEQLIDELLRKRRGEK